jgi:hypothetical protein
MPIRFRCAYCNQLMGIARRKAGTVVACPNCAGQVVVPTEDDLPAMTEGVASEAPPPPPSKKEQPLFERGDFDDVFGRKPIQAPLPSPKAPPAPIMKQTIPLPPPAAPASAPRLDLPPPSMPAPALTPSIPGGYVLSPSMATLLSVAVIVAVALAFTAGLLVGRFYLQPPSDESPGGFRSVPADVHRC